jgi:hypothetical protein
MVYRFHLHDWRHLMNITTRLATVAVALLYFTNSGLANTFSFVGNFVHDNDVQFFHFGLLADSTVSLETWSFGGGVNAQGDTILAGGFLPALQVYDAVTGLAMSGPIFPGTATCPPHNADPNRLNSCQDAFGSLSLVTGDYIVALTQWENLPLGNLADGFFYVDIVPDPAFNGGFTFFGLPGTSAWALDILSVDSASAVTAIPEPGSAVLACAGVLIAGIGARRRRVRAL